MKTRHVIIITIIIGLVISSGFASIYAMMSDCLYPPGWIKMPKTDFRYCWGLFVTGNLPDYPTLEEYLESKATKPEPEGGNPKLTELMESGGFLVETRTLRFSERTYTTLANAEDTKNEWFIVNGVLAFGSEMHEVIIPTILDLYTDDGKVTSVMSYVSLEETIEHAKTLELDSGYIDLNDYVDPNWTDGPTETLDEAPQIEPEPEEYGQVKQEHYEIEITGLKDVYIVGERYDFSYILSGYGHSCGGKTVTFPDSNGDTIGNASSASCIANLPMGMFVFDIQKEQGTTYGHVGIKNPGTYTVTVTFDRPSQYFPTTASQEFRVVEE